MDLKQRKEELKNLTVRALEVLHVHGPLPPSEIQRHMGCSAMEFMRAGIALTWSGERGALANYDGTVYSLTTAGKTAAENLFGGTT